MAIPQQPQLKSTMFGRMPVGGQKPPKSAAPAAAGPKGVPIEHRIGIQTPPEVIWDLISDLEGWSRWNPMYPQAKGSLHIGETITATIAIPGMKPREFTATILDWVPNEQLHWRAGGGLTRMTRYMEIEQLADASCIFANGEIFGGLLGPTIARSMGRSIYRGFREMNEALKEEAETRWRERTA
jgi:hypothetical protein